MTLESGNAMAGSILSEADVDRLLIDPSPENRVNTAAKLAEEFGRGALTDSQRKLAEEIFRLMVRDAEVRVREALALHLKESHSLPHDLAMTLAQDVDTVALPMIASSDVLTDADLLAIIGTNDPLRQVAVARRPTVSSAVSDALVDTHHEAVATTLAANPGADLTESSLQRLVDEFGDRQQLQGALVHRPKLPVSVAERLVARVSEELRNHLLTHHDLPSHVAADLVLQTRERAILGISGVSDEGDVEALVRSLYDNKRLTPSIILRSACMGDLNFLEASLARLCGIPLTNAHLLVHDKSGLRAIIERAGLPRAFVPALRAAVEVARELDYDGEAGDRERYARKMMERVLTQYGDLGVSFEADDLEYLLTKLNQLHPTAAA